MRTDYRALCAELEEAYAWCIEAYMTAPAEEDTLIQRARAAHRLGVPLDGIATVGISY